MLVASKEASSNSASNFDTILQKFRLSIDKFRKVIQIETTRDCILRRKRSKQTDV